ncbi:hypothetical protein L5515_003166 [Caenorhabditis briggsae]|uniref:Uncharacterized protein n=1 Tax=Caenorhabditis briggsae TaxID=6238 RepID=A0AAE9JBJ3_CAEBR|nr:hypothetical protein L5515_003166 [Caenorhabditis briggsae]
MDIKFKARSLWNTCKEVTIRCTKSLKNGIRFSEMYEMVPWTPKSMEYILVFVLFHIYLLYILIFCVSLEISRNFRLKSSGIAPITGQIKEKISIFLTYFFVFQSVSRLTFGAATWHRFVGWACQVKPQINFKPQIKLGKSKSSESVISVKNASKIDTSIGLGMESEDEETRKSIKKLGKIKKSVDFATDLTDAVIMGKEEPEDSICMVQKWLEDSESLNSEDVRIHVQKLMEENEKMKKQTSMISETGA